jgi:hypothetical protein
MKNLMVSLLACFLFACSSTEDTNTNTNTNTNAKNEAGYECKKIAQTGSRFKKKVCTTAAERELAKEAARKDTDILRNQRMDRLKVDVGG